MFRCLKSIRSLIRLSFRSFVLSCLFGLPHLGADDEGGYWNPVDNVSRLLFLFVGVLKP